MLYQSELDPNIPEDREILWKRSVRQRWTDYVTETLSMQPSVEFPNDTYLICLRSIWLKYAINIQQIAKFPNSDPFIYLLQDAAIRVLDRRNLNFESKYIYAIADPDHAGENPFMLLSHGFVEVGSQGYEMDLPVLLSKELDKKDFNLFFSLLWAQLDFTDNPQFFEFHLKESFQNDLDSFSTYIHQILLQFETLEMVQTSSKDDYNMHVLTRKHEHSFELWLSARKSKEPMSKIMEKDEPAILQTNEQERQVIINPIGQEILFTILEPFFAEADQVLLKKVLSGYDISEKLIFKGQSKTLVYAFRESHHKGIISSPKKTLGDWIIKNFFYLNYKTNQPHPFDRDNVKTVLYSRSQVQNDRINLNALDQFNMNQ